MRSDPTNFLHSFAKVLVTRAAAQTPSVALAYAGTPRSLWILKAIEGVDCADPYSVMAVYPGKPPLWGDRSDNLSVQVMTIGSDDAATSSRARCLFECFADPASGGQPIRMLQFNGYKLADDSADGTWQITAADPLQAPGFIGRTADAGRRMESFNVDLRLTKLT
jgi:hypothetical protein